MAHAFDPGAAAAFDGIYGLPHTVDEARVVVVPVPWDATTSYRAGTSLGPAAILEASRQVDLFDAETGRPYEAGIAMLPIADEVLAWNAEARTLAEPVIENGGAGTDPALQRNLDRVNALGGEVNEWVRARTHSFNCPPSALTRSRLRWSAGSVPAPPFSITGSASVRASAFQVTMSSAAFSIAMPASYGRPVSASKRSTWRLASRIAAGPSDVPARYDVVASHGTGTTTTRASSTECGRP